MDGYALRAADGGLHATLRVAGAAPAGHPFDGHVGPGEAVRLFTGSVVPSGANAILLQEDATRDGDSVRVNEAVVEGRPSHYSVAVQVFPEGEGRSRLVWTIDLLPDELAPTVGGMMEHALPQMKKTLEAA